MLIISELNIDQKVTFALQTQQGVLICLFGGTFMLFDGEYHLAYHFTQSSFAGIEAEQKLILGLVDGNLVSIHQGKLQSININGSGTIIKMMKINDDQFCVVEENGSIKFIQNNFTVNTFIKMKLLVNTFCIINECIFVSSNNYLVFEKFDEIHLLETLTSANIENESRKKILFDGEPVLKIQDPYWQKLLTFFGDIVLLEHYDNLYIATNLGRIYIAQCLDANINIIRILSNQYKIPLCLKISKKMLFTAFQDSDIFQNDKILLHIKGRLQYCNIFDNLIVISYEDQLRFNMNKGQKMKLIQM